MKKKIRWVTQTGVMLALLVAGQAVTKGFGQLVTGSCVNAVLALSALVGGLSCGMTVAIVSPVLAWLLNIAPQILTVPAIMIGNGIYVLVLHGVIGRRSGIVRYILGWPVAAAAKFAVLYGLVRWVVCDSLSEHLLEAGLLKAPMLQALPVTFGWPQLITALIGGGVAVLILPVLRKGLPK